MSSFTKLALPFSLPASASLQAFPDLGQHKMPVEIHVLLNTALTGRTLQAGVPT
jgi:hypothetical protein